MTEDELFFAWLDGELDQVQSLAVAERVAADPALSALADRHRALKDKLRSAFDSLGPQASPVHLVSDRSVELDEERDEQDEQDGQGEQRENRN